MRLRTRLTSLVFALVFSLAWWSPITRAEDDARAAAAEHWKRGVARANEHAYAEALSEFEAAYALVQHAATLYNIALAQLGLERPAAACVTLRRYLAEPVERGGESKRKAAQALLAELQQKLAQAPAAKLTVVVFPYGQAWLDDRALGPSPLVTDVAPGSHRVSGGREGQALAEDVVLEPGESRRVVLAWSRRELVQDETAAKR